MTETILPTSAPPSRRGPRLGPLRSGRTLGVVAALVVVAAGAVGYELTTGSNSSSPPQAPLPAQATPLTSAGALSLALQHVHADALAGRTVHLEIRTVSKHHGTATMIDDDATDAGIQRIHVDGGQVTARVDGSLTFFTGDRRGLTQYLRMSPAQASQVVGRWVQLTPGQPSYADITTGITLPSVMQNLAMAAPYRRLPTTKKDGKRVYGIEGRPTGSGYGAAATSVLWVTVGAKPLPVEFDTRGGGTISIGRFSNWGKAVNVAPPANPLGVN